MNFQEKLFETTADLRSRAALDRPGAERQGHAQDGPDPDQVGGDVGGDQGLVECGHEASRLLVPRPLAQGGSALRPPRVERFQGGARVAGPLGMAACSSAPGSRGRAPGCAVVLRSDCSSTRLRCQPAFGVV